MVRLYIEAPTYGVLRDWIYNLDQHQLLADVGAEITVRGKPVEKPFTLSLSASTVDHLAEQVNAFREMSLIEDPEESEGFSVGDTHTLTDQGWANALEGIENVFADGLWKALLHGDAPFITKELIASKLLELARKKGTTAKQRAAIYATLARLEEGEA